jgi:hypothetical protein
MEEIFPNLICDKINEYIDYENDFRRIQDLVRTGLFKDCECIYNIVNTSDYNRYGLDIYNYNRINIALKNSNTFTNIYNNIKRNHVCKKCSKHLEAGNKKEFFRNNKDLVTIDNCLRCEKHNFATGYRTSKEMRYMRYNWIICNYCMPILHKEKIEILEHRIITIENMLKEILQALGTRKIFI